MQTIGSESSTRSNLFEKNSQKPGLRISLLWRHDFVRLFA